MLQLTDNNIITISEANLLDKNAYEINKIPPIILMEEAADKIIINLKNDFKDIQNEKIAIISGSGNNGGDALSTARKLFFEGIKSDIYIFKDKKGSDLYEIQKNILLSLDIKLFDINEFKKNIDNYTIIIDGIFGIGYNYRKDKKIEDLFLLLNQSNSKIVSIDVPSGLNTDSHTSIKADYTYSIGFLKDYLFTLNTRKKVGLIRDLKISFDIKNIKLKQNSLYFNKILPIKKNKNNFVHKYSRGSCLSIGGSPGKFGSIIFTAESAINAGCGISCIITEKDNVIPINSMSNKIIVDNFENINLYINKYNTIAIGPGLNFINNENKKIIEEIIKLKKQFILDASFFTLFNKDILMKFTIPPILTPHSQELKYFFQEESSEIDSKTIEIISMLSVKYNCFILLKESFLVLSDPSGKTIIYDNPQRILAQAGSGDILTGIISGILSQGYEIEKTILESIRIFYDIAEKFNKNNYNSYSAVDFIDMLCKY